MRAARPECANDATPAKNHDEGIDAMNSSWGDQLDPLFAEWDRADSPGCALAVYQEGETVYQRGYGMAHLEHGVNLRPASVFHVASLSKQFTAMAIGLLARSGRIDLEDDLRDYIPEMQT